MSKTLVSCQECQALVPPGARCPMCGGPLPPGGSDGDLLSDSVLPLTGAFPASEPMAPDLAADFPKVPGYEIRAELGRGGMGVVYLASQVELKRVVALKMILAGDFASPTDHALFKAEAEAVARLAHPSIVQIYEIGEFDRKPYFSLEYVAGGSLFQRLGTPQPPRQAAELIAILARGVHAAHLGGIVHRDLKPANILLQPPGSQPPSEFCSSRYGVPKITDFGLAKHLDMESKTRTGTIMGTPEYMAPEQAQGQVKAIGPAADIYALGVILYEMLTGRPPFQSEAVMDTILLVAAAEPLPPSRLQPKVPRDLETICLKCLEKDIDKRYESAAALADDLRRFLTDQPIVARPVGWLERAAKWARRRPAVASLLAAVVLVTLAGVGGILWQWRVAVQERRVAVQETAKAQASLYVRGVAVAHREWQNRNIEKARLALAECPPGRRDWEWRYLNRLCHAELAIIKGMGAPCLHVAYSPDGRYLAAVDEDGLVTLWDAQSRRPLAACRGHPGATGRLAFSPDSRLLASAGGDLKIRLWDVSSGQLRGTWPTEPALRTHQRPISDLAFAPDGAQLASAGRNLLIWDVASGKTLAEYSPIATGQKPGGSDLPPSGALRLAYHPDGKRLAVTGMDGNVSILDLPASKVTIYKGFHEGIYGLAYSPDGRWLATCGTDLTIRISYAASFKRERTISGVLDLINDVAFSPDSQRIAGAATDETVLVSNLDSAAHHFELRGHGGPVNGVAFHPDGQQLASAGGDGKIRIWDARLDPEARAIREPQRPECVAFAPRGDLVAVCYANGAVQVWERASLKPVWTWQVEPLSQARTLAISPDGQWLAAGGEVRRGVDEMRRGVDPPGLVLVWDLKSGQLIQRLGLGRAASCLAFTGDGTLFASTAPFDPSVDRCPVIGWNVRTGQETVRFPGHVGGTAHLAMSPDGQTLASGGQDQRVRLWNLQTGQEQQVLVHPDAVIALAFHPGGQWLASAGRQIILWDLAESRPLRTLKGHKKPVTSLAFNPTGSRLVSGGHDYRVMVWDPASGQDLLTLTKHTLSVRSVAFSADGTYLATASSDRSVLLWHAPE